MKDSLVALRNTIIGSLYRGILKKILFMQDPENVHDRFILAGRLLGSNIITRGITKLAFSYSDESLKQEVLGIKFKNPIGLAAGFDKDAQLTKIMPSVGFGFEEVGSITGEECEGNPKPRLWRLKKSKGLVVYYGLKNKGSEIIASKLSGKKFKIPIGTSIAKTNCQNTVETKKGIADYVKAYLEMKNIGAYSTINISCPNAHGGLPFTDAKKFDMLMKEIDKIKTRKPLFVKFSPDLSKKEIDALLVVASKYKIDGFICSNLTKKKENKKIFDKLPETGGYSGKIVSDLSLDVIRHIYKKTKGKYIIIGCGGIFNAEDAYAMIKAGATLLQMITGMIFQGPQVISEINQGLVTLLEADGYSNIKEAVGADHE